MYIYRFKPDNAHHLSILQRVVGLRAGPPVNKYLGPADDYTSIALPHPQSVICILLADVTPFGLLSSSREQDIGGVFYMACLIKAPFDTRKCYSPFKYYS
jgi:hypothetical protein